MIGVQQKLLVNGKNNLFEQAGSSSFQSEQIWRIT